MSTKAQVEQIMDDNWKDDLSPIRVPENDRNVGQKLIDELYSALVVDNQTTQTYTTKTGTAINYSFTLKKSGNQVIIKGTITNNGFTVLGAQNVCSWKNTEYKPIGGVTYLFDAVQGSNKVRCFINNTVFAIATPMNSGIYSIENFQTYIAQD